MPAVWWYNNKKKCLNRNIGRVSWPRVSLFILFTHFHKPIQTHYTPPTIHLLFPYSEARNLINNLNTYVILSTYDVPYSKQIRYIQIYSYSASVELSCGHFSVNNARRLERRRKKDSFWFLGGKMGGLEDELFPSTVICLLSGYWMVVGWHRI